jgi:hypothetical protein
MKFLALGEGFIIHTQARPYQAAGLGCNEQRAQRHAIRPILPRSRHLPLAVTDGSLTENVNKTGVRFWTDVFLAPVRLSSGRLVRPRGRVMSGTAPAALY